MEIKLTANPDPPNPYTYAPPPPVTTTTPTTTTTTTATTAAAVPAACLCGRGGDGINRRGQGGHADRCHDGRSHRADAPKQRDRDGRDGLGQQLHVIGYNREDWIKFLEVAETEGDERQILKRGNSRLYR